MKKLLSVVMMMAVLMLQAQSSEKEERIKRDVEVAENVLGTLIRQQTEKKGAFWPMEVKGSYTSGFGVTLRIPFDNWYTVTVGSTSGAWSNDGSVTVVGRNRMREEMEAQDMADRDKLKEARAAKRDSAREAYGSKLVEAAKIFLADYGDLIGLEPNERILITSKPDRGENYAYAFSGEFNMKAPKRSVISVEALKSDLTQFKQGKMSRDQLYGKFRVMNAELNDETQPDLELLSTIFGRLYRSDLSKTFFTESGGPYYERMKDFGVTFYMKVYSSNENGYKRWNMPTVDLEDVSQEERDKKVKELLPNFEKDLKENILEYGRTLSSLKDEEMLIFDVTLTRCVGCGIPATEEFSVKASVLKDFGSGKLTKDAALAKITVKKGNLQ